MGARFPQLATATGPCDGAGGLDPSGIAGDPAGDATFTVTGLPDDLGFHDFARKEGQGSLQQQEATVLEPAHTLPAPGQPLDGTAPAFDP